MEAEYSRSPLGLTPIVYEVGMTSSLQDPQHQGLTSNDDIENKVENQDPVTKKDPIIEDYDLFHTKHKEVCKGALSDKLNEK